MTDYFDLLKEPHRPWLDADLLKTKFLGLSAEVHPDRVHGAPEQEKQRATQHYLELNAAYNCLRAPKSRLQHLLELELGTKPKEVQQIPPATMELFLKVGQLCHEVDVFLAERATVASPLLKVETFERAQEWTEQLNAHQRGLNARLEQLDVELRKMNVPWETAPAAGIERKTALPLQDLERIWRDLSYLVRWAGQIQERVVQLSF